VGGHVWANQLNGRWYNGYVPTGTDLRTIDQSISGCLNGDGGGNGTPWSPSAVILVGGAGMWAAGPWTIGAAAVVSCGNSSSGPGPQKVTAAVATSTGLVKLTVSGVFGPGSYTIGDLLMVTGVSGTTEANGPWLIDPSFLGGANIPLQGSVFANTYLAGGLVTEVESTITFGDNDYFVLQSGHSAQSRTIVTPVATAQAIPLLWSTNPVAPVTGNPVYGLASLSLGAGMDVPLRVHHDATLVSATVTFYVGQSHSGVPAVLPGVRLVGVNMDGVAFPLATTAVTSGTDATGMQFAATPASGSVWYNSGATQTFTFTCDPGIVIDTKQYSYHAVIQDEFGVNALTGNIYVEVELSFNAIADTRPQ
jgi:hypothetical protein